MYHPLEMARNAYRILVGQLERKENLGVLEILLKWVLEK
jgi:hypothetical protein